MSDDKKPEEIVDDTDLDTVAAGHSATTHRRQEPKPKPSGAMDNDPGSGTASITIMATMDVTYADADGQ